MDKEELVFTTIEDLIRYLGECGEDVQIHMEIEVEGERRAPAAAEEGDSQIPLTSPEGAAAVMRDVLKELDREWVCVVNMDNHLKPVNFNIVSIGSINQSLAPIQNILKSGILSNCSNIMLMHNHPSGDNEPSREDIQLTKRLVEAAKLMDMNVWLLR
nr:JAB domain-containing protein [uncultured Stomatobaculum sp.]